jgi:MoxR-like ATPase
VEALILKKLHVAGDMAGRELATSLGLRFSLIADPIAFLRQQRLIMVKRSTGMGDISSIFSLSDLGVEHARAALDRNKYMGAAPVPLAQYADATVAQKHQPGWLTMQVLRDAYRGIVISDGVLNQIGPAVSAGKSLLIYGQPGNGKTYLAEALLRITSTDIFIPYAINYQGNIVRVYDPMYHHRCDSEAHPTAVAYDEPYDARWVRCKRPFITTGGELTLSMLDLCYDAHSKTYDAPFQMKANNGIYLIDDFGRQQLSPAELLNRWIIPMERRIDYLSLGGGGKMTVPFEAFLVFSTNLTPQKLGDEAFLRRIEYKLHLKNPTHEEFTAIFLQAAERLDLEVSPTAARNLLEKEYRQGGRKLRRCHPRDLLSHAADYVSFHKLERRVDEELLGEMVQSCFGDSSEESELSE